MFDEFSYRILKFLRDRNARFKDLKAVVKNPRTLSIKLKMLNSLGLVEDFEGEYRSTQRGREVVGILEELDRALYSQRFKPENIERIPHAHFAPLIRRYCEILSEHLGGRLAGLMLFGSIARGNWDKNSDIDILVVADGWSDKPIWIRLKELSEAKKELTMSPEYHNTLNAGFWPIIQNYPLSLDEAKRFNRIYLDALIDGIILYDREGLLNRALENLRLKLEKLGSRRITLPKGKSYWILKDVSAGEVINLEWDDEHRPS